MQSELRKKIENYSYGLNDRISHGPTSNVFRGTNEANDERVAIKVIDMREPKTAESRKATEQEIQLHRKVNKSPNLVRLLDVYVTTNNCYIITEYPDEGDLQKLLLQRGKLSIEETIALFRGIFTGYEQIVKLGFIHGNINPRSVILKNRSAKITDFGNARKISSKDQRIPLQDGKLNLYRSPQSYQSNYFSTKGDIWSIGGVLYHLLHGNPPFEASTLSEYLQRCHKPYTISKELPEDLRDLISRCLTVSLDRRMDMKEFRNHPFILKNVKNQGQMFMLRKPSQEEGGSEKNVNVQGIHPNHSNNYEVLPNIPKNNNNVYNIHRTERQVSCQINWMRYLYRLIERLIAAEMTFAESADSLKPLKFIILRQLYTQFYNLMSTVYRGEDSYGINNWGQFYEDKEKLKLYIDILKGYEQRYDKIKGIYLKLCDELTHWKYKSLLNESFKLSQYNSIVGISVFLQTIPFLWGKIVTSKQKSIPLPVNKNSLGNPYTLIDFLITYYQLNCLLVDNFTRLDYFDKMSKLDRIIENNPVELDENHLVDLKNKMVELSILP